MSDAIIRRVNTVTATLLPDAITGVGPTRPEKKAAVDNNPAREKSESDDEDFRLLKPKHTTTPSLFQDAMKEELKRKLSNPEIYSDLVGVEHFVIGVSLSLMPEIHDSDSSHV